MTSYCLKQIAAVFSSFPPDWFHRCLCLCSRMGERGIISIDMCRLFVHLSVTAGATKMLSSLFFDPQRLDLITCDSISFWPHNKLLLSIHIFCCPLYHKSKILLETRCPMGGADLRFSSPQSDTISFHCETTDTELMHHMMCLFTFQPLD